MTPRNCPHCGSEPKTVYPPKTYLKPNGRKQTVHQAYCANCQATYSARPITRKPNDFTLDDILKDAAEGDLAWITAPLSSTRWRALRLLILDRDQWLCQIHGTRCEGKATQVDHIRPRSFGGDNHPANLRAACGPCNGSRHQIAPRVCHDCGSLNIGMLP